MIEKEQLTLVDGKFASKEAKEFLNMLFLARINFYKIKNLSSHERFGKDDEISRNRIHILDEELKRLQVILSDSETKDQKFIISSVVTIVADNV